MDLCSKIIHSFWNCQVCLKNKGISSLYAMKRCSAGEGTNVTLEYDLQDANEIISWVAVRSYEWSEQVKDSLFDEWASWQAPYGDKWNNFVSFEQKML